MSELEEWKKEIGEIPEPTCKDIDRCIKKVDEAMSSLKNITSKRNSYYKAPSLEDASDYADDAECALSDIEDVLETVRKDNEQLRALGEFWYEKCKGLHAAKSKAFAEGVLSGQRQTAQAIDMVQSAMFEAK